MEHFEAQAAATAGGLFVDTQQGQHIFPAVHPESSLSHFVVIGAGSLRCKYTIIGTTSVSG